MTYICLVPCCEAIATLEVWEPPALIWRGAPLPQLGVGVIASQVMLPHTDGDENTIDCHCMVLQRHLHTDLEMCHFSVIQVLHHTLEQLGVSADGRSGVW